MHIRTVPSLLKIDLRLLKELTYFGSLASLPSVSGPTIVVKLDLPPLEP
jgi:hypothetical protein